MIQDRFYLTRRDDPEGVEVREILRARMGSLDLVTPPSNIMARRRTLAALLGVGALGVAVFISFMVGNVTLLFALYPIAFVVTAVFTYFVQRWNLPSLAARPGVQVRRVRIVEATLGSFSHRLRIQVDDEELELVVQGLRRRVSQGLGLGGYPLSPLR